MINQQKTELKKFSIKNTKFFHIIDIYSQKIPLRFKGNEEYNTSIGFILGFLTLLFYFIISFYSLKDLFQRKNFSLISNTEYSKNSAINLKDTPFFFTLLSQYFVVPEINIHFIAKIIYIQKNNSGIFQKEINVTKCNYSNFIEKYPSFSNIEKEIFELSYCIDTSENIFLHGKEYNSEYSFFSINLYECVNSSEINTCSNSSTIDTLLSNVYVILGFLEKNINNYDYINPVSYNVRYETIHFTTSIYKHYKFFFSRIEYISNDGLLFNHIRKFNFFNLISFSIDFSMPSIFSILNPQFGIIYFLSQEEITTIERIYKKLPEVIASIEGIISITYFFINFILSFFIEKILMIDIINNSFFIEDKKQLRLNISKTNNKNIHLQDNNLKENKSTLNVIIYPSSETHNFNKKQINANNNELHFNNKKKEKIKFKFYQYFLPFFTQKKNEEIIFLVNNYEKIKQCISIENIYKKFENIKIKLGDT